VCVCLSVCVFVCVCVCVCVCVRARSVAALKAGGKYKMNGKEYVVQVSHVTHV